MTFPVLTTLVSLPLVGAALLRERSSRCDVLSGSERVLAACALLGSLVCALLATWSFDQNLPGAQEVEFVLGAFGFPSGPRLAVDAIALPLLLTTITLGLFAVLGTPRAALNPAAPSPRRQLRALLATVSATLLLECAADLDTFVVGWCLSLLPGWLLLRPRTGDATAPRGLRRMLGFYFACSTAPLLLAALLLHFADAKNGAFGSVVLYARPSVRLDSRTQEGILLLLGLSALSRKGMVPLHSWVPAFVERGSVGVMTVLLGAHAGVLLLLRVALPLLPDASRLSTAFVAGAAVASALYGAVLAFGQTNLRRTLGFVAVSQSSLILVGVTTLNQEGVSGALLQAVGFSLAFAGAAWCAHWIELRTGTADLEKLGGLVAGAPRAAGAFFLCAAALVGLPGSVGFVADELLIHGSLTARPVTAALLLLATALNAITLFRAYVAVFLGRPKGRPHRAGSAPTLDLLPRERWSVWALVALILMAGLFPGSLLELRERGVAALLHPTGKEPTSTH